MRELLMDKGMSVSALVVAVLILILFGLDLLLPKEMAPLGRPSMVLDIGFIISAAIVAILSFLTWRELK